MNHILDKFTGKKVLVTGDIMLDRYWWGDVSRISPEAPVPVVRLKRTSLAAGGAANVAANVAGLGAEPLLFGVIGNDHEAEQLRNALDEVDVAHDNLIAINDRPTTVKTRVIAHSQQVTRIDHETDSSLSPETEAALVEAVGIAIGAADAIVISDYAKGLITDGVLSKIIAAAAEAGKPLLVDPKGKDYTRYRGAAMITPNRREAAEACNFHENGEGVVERAGTKLIADLGIDAVLITKGEEGMTLFRRDREPVTFATAAREVYDVTGAGDTVIATLATAVAAGADLETATNLANIAAGLVVEQVGTTAIDINELRRAVRSSAASN
jgi:rfaE bifunctional protein kinase chain/domain